MNTEQKIFEEKYERMQLEEAMNTPIEVRDYVISNDKILGEIVSFFVTKVKGDKIYDGKKEYKSKLFKVIDQRKGVFQ